jgi:hypothetical protein
MKQDSETYRRIKQQKKKNRYRFLLERTGLDEGEEVSLS